MVEVLGVTYMKDREPRDNRVISNLNRFVIQHEEKRMTELGNALDADLRIQQPTVEQERNAGVRLFTLEDELNRTDPKLHKCDEEEEWIKKHGKGTEGTK